MEQVWEIKKCYELFEEKKTNVNISTDVQSNKIYLMKTENRFHGELKNSTKILDV